MLRLARARASSIRPVLSETERSARRTGGGMGFISQTRRRRRRRVYGSGAGEPELLQFLAQGAAVDAENSCGAALVALRVVEHDSKQRLLDLAQHQVVEMGGPLTVQAGEVIAQGALGMIAQRQFPPVGSGDNGLASSRPLLCGHCKTPQRKKSHSSGRHRSLAHPLFEMLKRVRELCGRALSPHQIPANLRRLIQQTAIPAEMFARDPDSTLLAVKKVQGVEMRQNDITQVGAQQRRRRKHLGWY